MNVPGTGPPTSGQWPQEIANAAGCPAQKIGLITLMSGWCVPPRYGSLKTYTSPCLKPSACSIVVLTDSSKVPRCAA